MTKYGASSKLEYFFDNIASFFKLLLAINFKFWKWELVMTFIL